MRVLAPSRSDVPRQLLLSAKCRLPAAIVAAIVSIGAAQAQQTPVLPPTGDALDAAVALPSTDPGAIAAADMPGFKFFVADQISYDSNVFRLPSNNQAYFLETAGPNAHRSDFLNTGSAGVDGQVDIGKQVVDVDVRVDDNEYVDNHELDNVGGTGKLIWNWQLGSQLGGQIGADFSRSMLGFANTTIYAKDLVDTTQYFGSIRYQVGPRWGIFAGVMEEDDTLSDPAAKLNDTRSTSGIFGADYAVGAHTTIGVEYRYTDTTYDYIQLVNAPDYRQDTVKFLVQYALTGKLQLEASGGYLKRNYSDIDAASQGFSGEVWRAGLLWQVTDKTQIVFAAKRDLQAYITEGADYMIDRGESITPVWLISDKLNLSLTLSADDDDFLSAGALSTTSIGDRRDKIYAEEIDINYTPRDFLSFKLGFRNEQRDSNEPLFTYQDELANIGVTYRFL